MSRCYGDIRFRLLRRDVSVVAFARLRGGARPERRSHRSISVDCGQDNELVQLPFVFDVTVRLNPTEQRGLGSDCFSPWLVVPRGTIGFDVEPTGNVEYVLNDGRPIKKLHWYTDENPSALRIKNLESRPTEVRIRLEYW